MEHEYEYVSEIPGVYAERAYYDLGWDTVDPEEMIDVFTEALDIIDPNTMVEEEAKYMTGIYKLEVDHTEDYEGSVYTLDVEVNGQQFCWCDVYLYQAQGSEYWNYDMQEYACCFQLALQGLIGLCQEHV